MHTEPEPTRNTGRNLPGFGFLPCLFPQPQVSPAGKRPNIIFLITDDQSPRMFNFLPEGKGNKPAPPNLGRLAAEGTVLMRQHVSSSVCTPSRFSCLTRTYASRATNRRFMRKFEYLSFEFGGVLFAWLRDHSVLFLVVRGPRILAHPTSPLHKSSSN
jgi:hypothetical protein